MNTHSVVPPHKCCQSVFGQKFESGSVSRVLCHHLLRGGAVIISLGSPLPATSSNLPIPPSPCLRRLRPGQPKGGTYLALHRVGFAAFHPDILRCRTRLCGTIRRL